MSLPRDTAPLLMLPYLLPPTHYHSVSLSLPPEARTLAPAAWQPLVSFTQLLCCLSHSQHSPRRPPPPTPPPPQQHWDGCSSQNLPPVFLLPLYSLPTQAFFGGFHRNESPYNVTGIPQLGQEEEGCLSLLLASEHCCKGIFGTAQSYPLSLLQRYIYIYFCLSTEALRRRIKTNSRSSDWPLEHNAAVKRPTICVVVC